MRAFSRIMEGGRVWVKEGRREGVCGPVLRTYNAT